jgi:hypothetical protein
MNVRNALKYYRSSNQGRNASNGWHCRYSDLDYSLGAVATNGRHLGWTVRSWRNAGRYATNGLVLHLRTIGIA